MSENEWISKLVKEFVLKQRYTDSDQLIYSEPLIGFSKGDDSLYSFFQNDIGPFYWTPENAFSKVYGSDVYGSKLSVISWILPQTGSAKKLKEKLYPSQLWVQNRLEGEKLNNNLRQYVVEALRQKRL